MSPAGSGSASAEKFFGHPRGLATLFFTEMWERFSYYGMRAILILYMTASRETGGLGFATPKAGVIYGLYVAMVYLMSIPGGWLADRLFGQRRAVLYGGLFIIGGQSALGLHSVTSFYSGLALLVLGTGLLKPNVSTMVGQLYGPEDHRRESGFSIFYMGINIGAAASPFLVGYIGQRINWNLGFAVAGIGMALGLVQYVLGGRHLGGAGLTPGGKRISAGWIAKAAAGAVALGAVVALAWRARPVEISSARLGDAVAVLLTCVTLAVFGWLFSSGAVNSRERRRFVAAAILFLAASVFYSASEQQGSTLNLFGDRNTDNHLFGAEFPSSWFQSLPAVFVIVLAPLFAWLWVWLGRREPSSLVKFIIGLWLVATGFAVVAAAGWLTPAGRRSGAEWLILSFFIQTCGEMCLGPVGLSAMTKLAPPRVAGLMMGVWFLTISIGGYVGGRVASLYGAFTPAELFSAVAAGTAGMGLLLALFSKPLRRLSGGAA